MSHTLGTAETGGGSVEVSWCVPARSPVKRRGERPLSLSLYALLQVFGRLFRKRPPDVKQEGKSGTSE